MKYLIITILFIASFFVEMGCFPPDTIRGDREMVQLVKIDTITRGNDRSLICTWKMTAGKLEVVTFEDIPLNMPMGTYMPCLVYRSK